jgi:protein-serine/threonine kinase
MLRTPTSRRRSSAKRVSLVAGRVSVIPNEPVESPPFNPTQASSRVPKLSRFGSTSSFLSVQSAAPPSEKSESFLGGRSIDEFEMEDELGRGAYGLVKKAREIQSDGSLGVRFLSIAIIA